MELSIFSTQELQALLQLNQSKIDSLNKEIGTALNYMAKEHEAEIEELTKTLEAACNVQAKTKKELAQRSIKTK